MKIDWIQKLRFFLQTMAFCLAVSAIQYLFQPAKPYELPLVYSICIGTSTWAVMDFGRHLFPSAAKTGWPKGIGALLLPLGSIVAGYVLGTLGGDLWFGWWSWSSHPAARSQLWVSITVTAIAGVVATYYFYSRSESSYLETQVSEVRSQANEARLKLLETQLEPHMLFNTLANLRVLIGTDPPRAQHMLDRLNDYLRATLNGSRATSHPLSAEFARLKDYLELMAVRMGPRLAYTLELPEALRDAPVPPLLLQPLVENSIRHGLEPKVEGGSIHVRAWRDGDRLALEVRDTGVGLATQLAVPDGGAAAPTGFGTTQVRERLSTAYGPSATIKLIANNDRGATTLITFPYQNA